jgi:protein involved in temperature-dependent protein secretion
MDPYAVQRAFPARWQAYLRARYAGPAEVQRAFAVCERTARKWLAGDTGANGAHVAVAVMRDGAVAAHLLFEGGGA